MWWISKNGHIEGPLPDEQVRRRINLNLIGSLDRVSQDRKNWVYLRDTKLWNPVRTLPEELEIPEEPHLRLPRSRGRIPASPQGAPEPTLEPDTPIIPDRLRMPSQELPRGKSNKTLIFAVCGVCVATTVLSLGVMAWMIFSSRSSSSAKGNAPVEGVSATTNSAPPKAQSSGFDAVREAVAIIKSKDGSGTGFLLDMDGKTYLVSNEHVVRSGSAIEARLIDGTLLSLGEFSVAADSRDLVRFEVLSCDKAPLHLREDMPNMGEQVTVYGNSLGGGVATESKGFIQGVGPKRVETNAEIVQGNSGSPLLDENGKLIAVAAFIKRESSGYENWGNKNTRYDGAVRRYAVRLNGVNWKVVSRDGYERQVRSFAEFEMYWDCLFPFLLFDSQKVEESKLVYNDLSSRNFHVNDTGFDAMLKEVASAYEKRFKAVARLGERIRDRKGFVRRLNDDITNNQLTEEDGKKMLAEYDEKTGKVYEKTKEACRKMILIRKEALNHGQSFLTDCTWIAPQMANGYDDDIRGSVAGYQRAIKSGLDLMNQKMKDLNKDIKELEEGDQDDED